MEIVLNSYGCYLSRENDLFLIKSEDGLQHFPPDVVRTITISKATRISSDAILLAIANNVDIIFTNELGHPQGRIWSVQYGSTSAIRKAQLEFLFGPKVVDWVKQLIIEKLNGQSALLMALQPDRDSNLKVHNVFKSAVNSIEDHKSKIMAMEGQTVSDVAHSLRGWEGSAARKYFACLSLLMPEEFKFEGRSRMPASDPFNAMLNYAYGMLYSKVEGALIKAGIDPFVGIYHRDEYNRPALVYDFIEPFRIWMDYVVLNLAENKYIPQDAFTIQENGACMLEPFARRILVQSVNDYLAEIISFGTKTHSRNTQIQAEAHKLANLFLKHNAHEDLDRQ